MFDIESFTSQCQEFAYQWHLRYSYHNVGLHTACEFFRHIRSVYNLDLVYSLAQLMSAGWIIASRGRVRLSCSGVVRGRELGGERCTTFPPTYSLSGGLLTTLIDTEAIRAGRKKHYVV